jgi:hypothetical protein
MIPFPFEIIGTVVGFSFPSSLAGTAASCGAGFFEEFGAVSVLFRSSL